ncbi:hypothetical protein AMTR_s00033p00201010 [Amborella trichopoda]|uniref:Uncharacterized protein n=1 Tax=Amborella trichopoda TaxID=13333 RepID=U5D1T8_AMBTC|nr:hypothetical protein AMTR_s00033p00201010 [Amborella trichopoda]
MVRHVARPSHLDQEQVTKSWKTGVFAAGSLLPISGRNALLGRGGGGSGAATCNVLASLFCLVLQKFFTSLSVRPGK